MGVEGFGSGVAPQIKKWLVVIEDNQRQLKDAIKDLIMEVKDVVTTLQLEISELATMIKIIMMALGNNSHEDGASEQCGKAKVSNSRSNARERDAQKLENFLFDIEKYFLASGIDSKDYRLNKAIMFLTDVTKVW